VVQSEGYQNVTPKESNARLDAVYEFITSSFDQKITLNDIRIAYACKLLTGEQSNISQVAFDCGFSNVSFFNRQLKAKMSMTPRAYKKTLTI